MTEYRRNWEKNLKQLFFMDTYVLLYRKNVILLPLYLNVWGIFYHQRFTIFPAIY